MKRFLAIALLVAALAVAAVPAIAGEGGDFHDTDSCTFCVPMPRGEGGD